MQNLEGGTTSYEYQCVLCGLLYGDLILRIYPNILHFFNICCSTQLGTTKGIHSNNVFMQKA